MRKACGIPIAITNDGKSTRLERATLGLALHSEDWLQRLIFDHPELLPVHDIEPGFGELVAIAREVPCGHGYIDNLYVTPAGDIVLVEAKLWRNVQSRREVVAQTLDYVAALTRMGYAQFEAAIRMGGRATGAPDALYGHLVGRGDEAEEARFVDAVSLNLKRGRLLALIVGDGIRQEAEVLASLLQSHAGAHFTFALVELAVWRDTNGTLLVLPNTLAQTVMIERGVVIVQGGSAEVLAAPPAIENARGHSITEEMYYEALAKTDSRLPDLLRAFLAEVEPLGVYPVFLASLNLRVDVDGRQKPVGLGYVTRHGKLWTSSLASSVSPEAGLRYNGRLALIIGGEVATTDDGGNYLSTNGKSAPSVISLVDHHRAEWIDAIRDAVFEARHAAERA